MVPPNIITYMTSPSNQGNVPGLISSAGHKGGDHPMGGAYDVPPPSWQHGYGHCPEAHAVPQ
eukprot:5135976-Prorocentrum_lima.AAC.1